jgi:hypothetical protein
MEVMPSGTPSQDKPDQYGGKDAIASLNEKWVTA